MNLKETLKDIDANIEATQDLISMYADKKDRIESSDVKSAPIYLCGSLGCVLAMFNIGTPSLDLMILAGFGGGMVGSVVPYLVKKIRIADLDYQIWVNNSIINDLNKKRERKMAKDDSLPKQKKLHL